MGLLQNRTVYVSGPVENSSNATSWRNEIAKDLEPLGVVVWDPLIKPNWMHKLAYVDGIAQRAWKPSVIEKTGEYNEIYLANRQLRKTGLRLAAACDFVICRMNGEITYGTHEELNIANECGKPILFWSNQKIPSMWMFDQFADLSNMNDIFFSSKDELLSYLKKVDSGEVEIDPIKWIFLTWGIK